MRAIDENAFIAAYDEYADPIFRYCYFRVYDRERARELSQETFAKAWEYLSSGKKIDNLRAFLYRTAHNVCVNEVLRNKPVSLDEMREFAGFEPEERGIRSPEEDAESSHLLEAMKQLRPESRELLTLRYMNGLDVKEIAESLGQAPNTVTVRIKRATDELRRILQPSP